jgi:hypothetical protein
MITEIIFLLIERCLTVDDCCINDTNFENKRITDGILENTNCCCTNIIVSKTLAK